MKPHDVYSYGMVSSSTLYDIRGEFPAPEGYAEIDDVRHMTGGDAAIWYARPEEAVKSFQPYAIDPVDTTGGGDSFRAGVVYGFLKGWNDDKMIDFAAAVAAITCTRFPGVLNAPTCDEVADFMSAAKS